MNDSAGYAVFFFAPALEALGDAIKPYLQDGPAGPHVPCREVDTGGAFIEMTLQGQAPDGRPIALELMVPGNMVRMIVSAHSDNEFGFYDRNRPQAMLEPGMAIVSPADATPGSEAVPTQAPTPAS
jgi:hypothetical protein